MARTAIAATQSNGPNPTTGLLATAVAADTVNFQTSPLTGRELLIALNTGASPYTVTITSKADPYGRSLDITTFSVPAAVGAIPGIGVFGPFDPTAWRQTDGGLWYQASNAAVVFVWLRMP